MGKTWKTSINGGFSIAVFDSLNIPPVVIPQFSVVSLNIKSTINPHLSLFLHRHLQHPPPIATCLFPPTSLSFCGCHTVVYYGHTSHYIFSKWLAYVAFISNVFFTRLPIAGLPRYISYGQYRHFCCCALPCWYINLHLPDPDYSNPPAKKNRTYIFILH